MSSGPGDHLFKQHDLKHYGLKHYGLKHYDLKHYGLKHQNAPGAEIADRCGLEVPVVGRPTIRHPESGKLSA